MICAENKKFSIFLTILEGIFNYYVFRKNRDCVVEELLGDVEDIYSALINVNFAEMRTFDFVINPLFLMVIFYFLRKTKRYLLLLPVDMMGGQYVAR